MSLPGTVALPALRSRPPLAIALTVAVLILAAPLAAQDPGEPGAEPDSSDSFQDDEFVPEDDEESGATTDFQAIDDLLAVDEEVMSDP